MTVDLTPATSQSTVPGYGLAPSRGILNSTAHIMPAGPAPHSTEARDQFSGHGSEHCVEVQSTADDAVTTVASPLGAIW